MFGTTEGSAVQLLHPSQLSYAHLRPPRSPTPLVRRESLMGSLMGSMFLATRRATVAEWDASRGYAHRPRPSSGLPATRVSIAQEWARALLSAWPRCPMTRPCCVG